MWRIHPEAWIHETPDEPAMLIVLVTTRVYFLHPNNNRIYRSMYSPEEWKI